MSQHFIHRPQCELCGSSQKTILLSRPFLDQSIWPFLERYYEGQIEQHYLQDAGYEVAKCLLCGFIWQTNVFNETLMDKLYNEWISADISLNKKLASDVTLFSKYAREVEAVAPLLGKKPGETTILDFGMGWGHWCLMAKAFGYNITGFEVSAKRIAFAKAHGVTVIENFEQLKEYQFDFIQSEQVFEHILQPGQTLATLSTYLKPGGVIRLATPNGHKTEQNLKHSAWQASKDALHPLEHINCYTPQSFIELGKRANLKMIKSPFIAPYRFGLKKRVGDFLRKYYWQNTGLTFYFRKI